MAVSQYSKFSRNKILNSLPTKSFGSDGDIVLSKIGGKGVYLCSKVNGIWYAANKLEELRKIEKSSISELVTKKISVKSLIDASKDTDKFIVSDAGQLKYRTGDEVVGDLGIPVSDINYKTAYCSIGEYTDKESCELNGGSWYYSENDSHDSISSTAENELLTVGSSLGKLDAEPTLIYDGSQLEIKYNSDFDDNWQTSAQTSLLKLSYDSSNSAIFDVGSSGDLTLQSDGNLILSPKSGGVKILDTDNSDDYAQMDVSSTGGLTITTTDAASGLGVGYDADIILVADGEIELKASAALSAEINFSFIDGLGTKDDLFTFSGAAVSTVMRLTHAADAGDYCQIATAASGATKITTVDDGAAVGHLTLDVDGDVILDPASGITKFYYNGDTDDLCTLTVGANGESILATADSDGAAGHFKIAPDGNLLMEPVGSVMITSAGRTDFIVTDNADDFGRIAIDENGGMSISTIDDAAAAAHMILNPDGDCTISPKSGHLYVYDSDNSSDYAKFDIGGNGNLEISTIDAAGADAHITLKPDGAAIFEPATYTIFQNGNLHIGEKASATTDIAGYGQLWVKTASPNNLYFTDDVGNDKLISGVSSIISAMVFG